MIAPAVKRATIYLNPDLHRALKIMAARCGTSISELMQEAAKVILKEDIIDLEAIKSRKNESEKDFNLFIKELKKDGLL